MASKINTEGNTYEARWKATGSSYVAWLKRRPKQRVQGSTQEELIEQLWEIAMEAYGDGEACIELVPPLPVTRAAANYFDPPWFLLSCNEGFHRVGDSAGLYRDGLCSFCHAGLGGRNGVERVVDRSLRGDLGFIWGALPHAAIVSDAFIKFFRPLLGPAIRALPCRAERRAAKRMWELEFAGDLKFVCHKRGTHAGGVVCPKCRTARYGFFVYERIQKGMTYAIARTDAEKLTASVCLAAAGSHPLILIHERLTERVKQSLEGVLLDRVAILPAAEIRPFKITRLKKSDV